ncbi:MAG: aldehyde dehydrogenase family protein, partial [Saprospiraceae bacterium]|nr:aldehyde dehydrogenase family protein [Saprospiraceae bacterium]
VGFTGSYKGGKALMDIASQRKEPIPVYAEMGSNNPMFILPGLMNSDKEKIASNIAASVNLGAGQFCTNPGILVVRKTDGYEDFVAALKNAFMELQPSVMLNHSIYKAYEKGKISCANRNEVEMVFQRTSELDDLKGNPAIALISAQDFITDESYQNEVFGPFTLLVSCENDTEFLKVAECLHGQLTCTIYGNEDEIVEEDQLAEILTTKCGRLIYNGVPTGVEVSHAMHHGGPFPSSSNGMYTSVGTAAIDRFARTVCFQNAPVKLLPDAIKPGNPLNIWRTVNGVKSRS